MKEVRAVVVDRDGVLTDFDMAAANDYFDGLLPISLEEMWMRWEAWGDRTGFPRSLDEENTFFRAYWDSMADEFAVDEYARNKLRAYDYTECLVAYPDARPALDSARRAMMKVGVLSNFALASLEPSLEATGLSELVDVACAATVIGVSKPDVQAYKIVADALGVTPEECLFFDDEEPCVDGALRAGMTAYLVDRSLGCHDLANGVVCSLGAIASLVGDMDM